MNKRRFVPIFRDFPEGCGVSWHKSNSGESLIQSKGFIQVPREFPVENLRIEEFDRLNDIVANEEPNGVVIDHEEKEVTGLNQSTSSEKKRRLSSSHNSTMEVKTDDLVNTEKTVIVSGLAASSKCPWSQPKKRGRRQVKVK